VEIGTPSPVAKLDVVGTGNFAGTTTAQSSAIITATQGGSSPTINDSDALAEEIPLAIVGIVPCKVVAENGPIVPGDLLVMSSTPGYAMGEGPEADVGCGRG